MVGKPEGKRPSRKHGQKWEDSIKFDREKRFGGAELYNLAEDSDWWWGLANTVMNLQVS
jgi:hypothetical protein